MSQTRVLSLALLGAMAALMGPELGPSPNVDGDPPKRPDGPPNRSREEERRRKQMARQEVNRLAAQSEASAGAAVDWEGGGL